MANYNKILKLLIENLSNKNPGIKGLHNYSKKVPELQGLRPESELLLLDKFNKAIDYKDFGDYERIIHAPYKNIIYDIKRNLNELIPTQENKHIFDEYLNKYNNEQKLLQREDNLYKLNKQNKNDINDLEYFSKYYEDLGDDIILDSYNYNINQLDLDRDKDIINLLSENKRNKLNSLQKELEEYAYQSLLNEGNLVKEYTPREINEYYLFNDLLNRK